MQLALAIVLAQVGVQTWDTKALTLSATRAMSTSSQSVPPSLQTQVVSKPTPAFQSHSEAVSSII